jgi:hypothetical protein
MAKRLMYYLEAVNGHAWTLEWLRTNLEKVSAPTFTTEHPNPKQLWELTETEFKLVEQNRFVQNLRYHVYTCTSGHKPHRNRELEKPPKQRVAEALGAELKKFKTVKSKAARGLLALAD